MHPGRFSPCILHLQGGGDDGDDDEDAPKESRASRVFFCLVMACASAFAAMCMTAWTRTDG